MRPQEVISRIVSGIKRSTQCRLCLLDADLCNSHIIPEFCFEPLYDPEKRNFIEFDVSDRRVRKHQRGFRERLLCPKCEAIINVYEKHARRLFVDPLPKARPGSKMIFDYPQLEYRLLKLYAMSLVWRASVSSLDIFKHVKLGPHAEEFRKCLYDGVAPEPSRFGCACFRITKEGEHFTDFMPSPSFAKQDGHRYYRFLLRGFLFLVYASPKMPKEQEVLVIRNDGPVFVMNTEFSSYKFLVKLWEAGAAGDFPEI